MNKGDEVKFKGDKVDISFRVDSDLSKDDKEQLVFDIMDEINDRMMYTTEVKINDITVYDIKDIMG